MVRATVDHFSDYGIGDWGLPAWYATTPLQKAWQVSLVTGAATYDYPIEVPAGPGGLKPELVLRYNSAQTDDRRMRREVQTTWVGKGWTLDAPYISGMMTEVKKSWTDHQDWRLHWVYALVMDGVSYRFAQTNSDE